MSVLDLLKRDLARYPQWAGEAVPIGWRTAVESLLFKGGFQAVVLYRISHGLAERGWIWLAWLVARWNLWLTGADIEFSAAIGPGLFIAHPCGIVIGRGTTIGADATIYQGVTCGIRGRRPGPNRGYPCIGDGVVLYARSSVLGGVRVGDRAVIGAHALVTFDVPDAARAEAPIASLRQAQHPRLMEVAR
jgi:serine O-acetyltransferase